MTTNLDWNTLTFDTPKDETRIAVRDEDWQILRDSLKEQSLELKYLALTHWLKASTSAPQLYRRKLQVGNYLNALRRAGIIPRRHYE